MTNRQLEIIQHALGCDQYGKTAHRYVPAHPDFFPYHRNHFCAGGRDEVDCRGLVELGYMQQHKTTEMLPYFNCSVTKAGIDAMQRESPAPPKLSRSQVRYREWLDADCGLTFKEWMVSEKQRKEVRDNPNVSWTEFAGL
jgi:hypothetical protein